MSRLADVHGLLMRGIAAAKANDKAEAERYLEYVLLDPAATHQEKAQAHVWLTELTDDLAAKRTHLEQALACDPGNAIARRGLAILDGRLKPEEIINPDQHPTRRETETPRSISSRRFVCPKCGGTMGFEAGNQVVRCTYCGHQQTVLSALQDNAGIEEHDFIVALATSKGHSLPAGVFTFQCQGCRARLLLSQELSAHCPYCGSPHVVQIETEEMVQPEGIIPFAVTLEEAQKIFRRWLDKNVKSDQIRTTRVRGVYLPGWTFDISNEIRWRGTERHESRSSTSGFGLKVGSSGISFGTTGGYGGSQVQVHEGSYYLLENDILVPASHTLPQDLNEVFDKFLLEEAVPYESAYLADWPTVLYEISVSDASLLARQRVFQKGKKAAEMQAFARVPGLQNFRASADNLTVLSYKLLLLPLWIANYRYEEKTYTVAINGQTRSVSGQKAAGFFKKLVGNILG